MASPKDKLLARPWIRNPGILALVRVLADQGVTARFVGGCVRDALLDRDSKDVDLAVDAEPDRVISILKEAGIRTVPTGFDHGTVTALTDGGPVEVTSLRRDVETDGRRAVIAFTTDWREDSLRRDFTVNALYADPDGTILDFHGGLADLRDGRLRFIGSGEQRIREDVLRILRFFRFHGQLGLTEFDGDGLKACRNLVGLLPQLSAERVTMELLRLLEAEAPIPALDRMIEDGFLDYWAPEISGTATLDRLDGLGLGMDPLRRLAALCPVSQEAMGSLATRLKLSKKDRQRLVAMADPRLAPANEAAGRTLLYSLGKDTTTDLALVRLAREGIESGWQQVLDLSNQWTIPNFPLSGKDALALGATPGKAMGDALKRIEANWIDGGFRETRAELQAQLKTVLEEQGE